MSLYIGKEKRKINLNGITYIVQLISQTPIVNNVMLLSSEGYILKDSNELYLTAKDDK